MTKISFSFSVPFLRLLLSSFATNIHAPSFFPLLPFPSPPSPSRCPSPSSFPLPLHGRSFHLHPFLAGNPSFSSSSPTSPPYHAPPSPLISPSPSQWHAPPPPLFVGNPSLPLPFLLIPFSSSSSSYSKPIHKPSPSMVAPSIFALSLPMTFSSPPPLPRTSSPPPPFPPFSSSSSFSSSNPIHEAFNVALPLHADLRDPAFPFHSGSLHLRLFVANDLSSLLLIPFSSLLSFSPYFTLPLHGGSLHLYPFLANDPSSLFSSSPSPPPPPPIPPFSSSSSSSNSIHKIFYAALPLHNDSLLHLFLAGDPSYMSEKHFHPLKL